MHHSRSRLAAATIPRSMQAVRGWCITRTSNVRPLTAEALQATRDQIEKDLHRTFPAGAPHDAATIAALRRVLVTYATYNTAVGYCQGMNFLAAVLLMHLPEEAAFWGLHALAERILQGYFLESMRGALTDQLVCGRLLQRHFPTVAQHARSLQVDVAQPVLQWCALPRWSASTDRARECGHTAGANARTSSIAVFRHSTRASHVTPHACNGAICEVLHLQAGPPACCKRRLIASQALRVASAHAGCSRRL